MALSRAVMRGAISSNQRRELLNEWAGYCSGQNTIEEEDQKVVQLRRAE